MIGLYLFQSALGEYLRPRRTLVWVFVAGFLTLTAFLWMSLSGSGDRVQAYATMSTAMVYRTLPLVAAIFSAAVLTQEVAQKTIVYLVTRPVPRSWLITSRMAAAAVTVFLIASLMLVAVSVGIHQSTAAFSAALARDILVVAVGSAAYVSFFVLISLWANKAVVLCLLYAYGWETLATSMAGDLYRLSIHSYLTVLGEKPPPDAGSFMAFVSGQLGANTLTTSQAWPVMLGLIVVCVAACAVWFSRFEYVPREDTE